MALRQLGRSLLQLPLKVGRAYDSAAKRRPFSVGVWTTVVKTSAADYFAQRVVEKREEIDWQRNLLFGAFGFAYLGCFQYWLYNSCFTALCRPITAAFGHWGAAPVKTFLDQCIHHPFLYFPCFYVCKGAVEGRSIKGSLAKYEEDMWENCKALWMVWVPAQLVNFSVVPAHLRVPFVAGVSFAWTVIISVMRGKLEVQSVDDPMEVPVREPITHIPEGHDSPHPDDPTGQNPGDLVVGRPGGLAGGVLSVAPQ